MLIGVAPLGTIGFMERRTICVVEDENNLRDTLRYNLEREGYLVLALGDGLSGLQTIRTSKPDMVILDIMLPGMSGKDICREVRRDSDVPILMLTARGEETDKVVGLELGADDYVTKPFSMKELIARVGAMLRRPRVATSNSQSVLRAGNLRLDRDAHSVWLDTQPLTLKPKEYDLLALFVGNRGRAFSRDQLIASVWGDDYYGDTRTVDVHVRWLRRKIEHTPDNPQRIVTVRGLGYRFEG